MPLRYVYAVLGLIFLTKPAYAVGLTPPPSDLSIGFLQQIFGDLIPGGTAISGQNMLGEMFRAVTSVIGVVAAVYAVGTMVMGSMHTAHDGKWLGERMKTGWVALRFATGFGSLAPVVKGYSLIQIVVLWGAVQGIAVADHVWGAALHYLSTAHASTFAPPAPDQRTLAEGLLRSEACYRYATGPLLADHNTGVRQAGGSGLWSPNDMVVQHTGVQSIAAQQTYYQYTYGTAPSAPSRLVFLHFDGGSAFGAEPLLCGGVDLVIPNSSGITATAQKLIDDAQISGLHAMLRALDPAAQAIATSQPPPPGAISAAVAAYQSALDQAIRGVNATQFAARDVQMMGRYAADQGWASAGGWYWSLAHADQQIADHVRATPQPLAPKLQSDPPETAGAFPAVLARVNSYVGADGLSAADRARTDKEASDPTNIVVSKLHGWLNGVQSVMVSLLSGTSWATSGLNSVEALAQLGNYILDATGSVIVILAGVMAVKGSAAGWISNAATGWAAVAKFLMTLGWLFIIGMLATGIGLAVYLPAIPFLIWVSNVAAWLIEVLMFVVAAPLWAAAHMTPEGEGLVSQAAEGAYRMFAALVLRPTFMVFGLVLSFLAMDLVVPYVGKLWLIFIDGMSSNVTFAGLFYTVGTVTVFSGIMIHLAHRSFALIHVIPDRAMQFIGGPGTQGLAQDEAARETHAVVAAGAHSTQQGVTAAMQPKGEAAKDGDPKAAENAKTDTMTRGETTKR